MLWIKAFHIVAVVSWFAGLFYLPRLFVYHAMSSDQISRERFQVMERKLYRGIMTPAMIVALLLGFWLLALNPGWLRMGWIHVKLLLVAVLIGYHLYCGRIIRQLKEERDRHTHVFFRWFNEFPVLILIAVVILVVVKPF